ncbi:MAG: VCBS repeat-containing protein [Gammaproteobacteria bacterium]|nr:VCBS repeat-containing protein [Gammaproteobacteria bacterium]
MGGGERCELGDGLSGTAFLVDWRGDGGRDILYSLLPNMHRGGVYLYRERRGDRAAVPVYDPPEPVAGVTGYHAMPLVTREGELHLLTFGNPTRDPAREVDPGWLKLYRNRGPRSSPRFAAPAERIPVDGRSLAEVFAAADLWNLNPYQDGAGVTHVVISCLYQYVLEYWPDARGTDLRDYPNMGAGRGYRADGTWMGRKPTTRVFLLRNTGSNAQPVFGPPEQLAEYRSWDGRTDAALVDVDRDGALELLVRRDVDRLFALRLLAVEADTAGELPRFRATGEEWELPCSPLRRGYFETSLCCCDLDGDGEQEILITGNPGVVIWLDFADGEWRERPPLQRVGGAARVETLAVPCLADLDGSGAPDLVVGDSSGYLWRFANRAAGPGALDFAAGERLHACGGEIHHLAGPTGSIQGPNEARWGYLNPLLTDWDGDGLCDVVTNDIYGRYLWYRNTGSRKEPRFAAAEPLSCAGAPLTGAWRSRPAAWGDGCLLLLNHDGFLQLYRRAGADPARLEAGPLLRYRDGNLVRGCGPGGLWGRSVFCACDWDLDGTRDLVAGTNWHISRLVNGHFPGCATPFWLRNTGTGDEPVFERPRLITEADGTPIDLGHHKCSVWCHDLDGDGAPDLICGAEDGKTYAWLRSHLRWDWDPATRFAAGPITTTSGSGLVINVDPRVRERVST